MEDLSGKVDNVSTLPADEWNQLPTEVQNVITSAGFALTDSDLLQLVKSVAIYVSSGEYYIDSGAVNTVVLATVGSLQAPTAYQDGQKARFIAAVTNTGPVTVNVAGGGVAPVVDEQGGALTGGEVKANLLNEIYYDFSNSRFKLKGPIAASQAEVDAGTNNTKFVTALTLENKPGLVPAVIAEPSAQFVTITSANSFQTVTVTGATANSTVVLQIDLPTEDNTAIYVKQSGDSRTPTIPVGQPPYTGGNEALVGVLCGKITSGDAGTLCVRKVNVDGSSQLQFASSRASVVIAITLLEQL